MANIFVHNLDRPLDTPLAVRNCDTFGARLRGLMWRPPLAMEKGILLVGKRESRIDAAIHMFFMRMDLAVVWLNADCVVVDVQLAKRWRPAYVPQKPALYILEIAANRLHSFQVGDRLRLEGLLVGSG